MLRTTPIYIDSIALPIYVAGAAPVFSEIHVTAEEGL